MKINFNDNWEFQRVGEDTMETVTLPHTARLEALVTGQSGVGDEKEQWQGICRYKKVFNLPKEYINKKIYIHFEAAMNIADVFINDVHITKHLGGFVPFTVDITDYAKFDEDNAILVELDNRDNPVTGPKPLNILDFNTYHGLYRNVYLVIKEQIHISDPILENKTASGGLFITYPEVTAERALIQIQTHINNYYHSTKEVKVKTSLIDSEGNLVKTSLSEKVSINTDSDMEVMQKITLENPKLWSVNNPYLYNVMIELLVNDEAMDSEIQSIGIRHFKITEDGFWLNGEKMYLRGANRHQEYPYIGYAIPDDAQYRDAKRIKEAGFDYIRLSHYLHSPAFMDACDELGLLVMNCIPGWQYYGDKAFEELQYQNTRDMVRRDRNHACVLLWEASLNETHMPDYFIKKTHELVHEEYPGDQCFTCGWMKGYDVFGQARQHGGCVGIDHYPCVVTEYGDWEYYAGNQGFNQDDWGNLKPSERNSRQLRGDGEIRLLQQAVNYQEAHNDNLKTKAFADSIWVMYDYNRGYAEDIEASGIMDIFRLPKFSYYFFKSQRDADIRFENVSSGPMVYIANYWSDKSPLKVKVYSNCEEVALYLNGRLIERKASDNDKLSTDLAHPPFTFSLPSFESGELRAEAFISGKVCAEHTAKTALEPKGLKLLLEDGVSEFNKGDIFFVYTNVVDENGTTVSRAENLVHFNLEGPAELIGQNPIKAEAGIAAILVKVTDDTGTIKITASSEGLNSHSLTL
jgi:beta-galactosidase